MEIAATVRSSPDLHQVELRSGASWQTLGVPLRPTGGSLVNGGEFLMLALATCYCNDLYREAERLGIAIDSIEVEASANFPGPGLVASDIRYKATVASPADATEVARLLEATDAVAEVHNTLRSGAAVTRIH